MLSFLYVQLLIYVRERHQVDCGRFFFWESAPNSIWRNLKSLCCYRTVSNSKKIKSKRKSKIQSNNVLFRFGDLSAQYKRDVSSPFFVHMNLISGFNLDSEYMLDVVWWHQLLSEHVTCSPKYRNKFQRLVPILSLKICDYTH